MSTKTHAPAQPVLSLAFTLSLVATLAPLLSLGACADDFDPGSYLASLRLLGIAADLPIAHPG